MRRRSRATIIHLTHRLLSALAVLVLMACVVVAHAADTVEMKNGDHLSGQVTLLDGGKLVLTTAYAGAVTINLGEVRRVQMEKPLLMTEKGQGKAIAVTGLELDGDHWTASADGTALSVPAADLIALRSAAAEQAYIESLHPGLTHGWTGNAALNVAFARGNSNTTTIGTTVNLDRPTTHDKTSLLYTTIYARDGLLNETTAESTNAGLRYNRNINPRIFAFGTANFDTNALQDLDLRTTLGAGLGWHAIDSKAQQLDLSGGAAWTRENYSAVAPSTAVPAGAPAITNTFASLEISEQYTRKFGASTFTEEGYFYPNVSSLGEYRATVNSTLSMRVSSWLSWQTSFSDIYVTNPQVGTKDNDTILTTGLGLSFTRK